MLSKALRRIAIAMLLAVSATLVASVTQAQTLDQTLSGCNGAAPLRTVQADRSNYQTKVNEAIPGDRILLGPTPTTSSSTSTTSTASRASASSSKGRPTARPSSRRAIPGTSSAS